MVVNITSKACMHSGKHRVHCLQDIYNHPWYNKNLPPGVKEMNDRPQPLPEGLQTIEEISRIVQVRYELHILIWWKPATPPVLFDNESRPTALLR